MQTGCLPYEATKIAYPIELCNIPVTVSEKIAVFVKKNETSGQIVCLPVLIQQKKAHSCVHVKFFASFICSVKHQKGFISSMRSSKQRNKLNSGLQTKKTNDLSIFTSCYMLRYRFQEILGNYLHYSRPAMGG
jgi:hypothetical protein